jgi:hypothetical protein
VQFCATAGTVPAVALKLVPYVITYPYRLRVQVTAFSMHLGPSSNDSPDVAPLRAPAMGHAPGAVAYQPHGSAVRVPERSISAACHWRQVVNGQGVLQQVQVAAPALVCSRRRLPLPPTGTGKKQCSTRTVHHYYRLKRCYCKLRSLGVAAGQPPVFICAARPRDRGRVNEACAASNLHSLTAQGTRFGQ